ncbi:MAG: flagellar protein FliT [Gammaproteobacteria bacterium]|nr:flagellar protein FliT [Gammaproteobacteria bacterium]
MTEHDAGDIAQLRRLTRELLDSATAGDWDTAIAIEVDRRPLLSRVFAAGTSDTQDEYRILLNEILSVDREIMRLTQLRRDEVAGVLRQVAQGRSGCQAYESNSR